MTEGANATAVEGACLCGAVRFRVRPPTLFCGHCHCTMCQRNHGAGYVTWFGVARDQLEMLKGSALLTTHASSPQGTRSFCSACGSALFCENSTHPDHVDIPLANMEGPIDREPALHFYFDTHVDWISFEDGLPKRGGESGMAPLDSSD